MSVTVSLTENAVTVVPAVNTVKVGSGLSITGGVLSAAAGTDAATVNSLVFAQTY